MSKRILSSFVFVWCPCMAINISVQYNGRFLPDIILLTQGYHHWVFKCHEAVVILAYETTIPIHVVESPCADLL